MKDVGIIVVNFKMREHIEKCFVSLFSDIEKSGLNVGVVVVDNASDDGINAFLRDRFPQAQCIMLPDNYGFGRAQNIGMQSLEARYYFVLNPDTRFVSEQSSIRRLYDFMESHPHAGMAAPKLHNADGSLQYSCWRFPTFWQPVLSRTRIGSYGLGKKISNHYFMKDFDHLFTRTVDAIMGSAMFVRGEVVKSTGGFDDRYWMYFEDTDWCLRVWEAGWAIYYVHDTIVQHAHQRGSAQVAGIIQSLFKNKLARIHLISWLKYMWKWRGVRKYYAEKI